MYDRHATDRQREVNQQAACGRATHLNRRTLLKSGAATVTWLTPLAQVLARQVERKPSKPAKSVILLWLGGGPSQLETFDPHADSGIAAGTKAIDTSLTGIKFAAGMKQTAGVMHSMAVVRNMVSREGDHERAAYNFKTGYRPDPTLVHPSIGAVLCHQLPTEKTEIPRHISILPDDRYGRGGYLGAHYDAFKTFDPQDPIPDVKRHVSLPRFRRRMESVEVVDRAFSRGRLVDAEQQRTLHRTTMQRAERMMSSEQLTAFDISREPQSIINQFGDSPFGRGCLAALRLIPVGVRCIEVTLSGWDSHINNHEIQNRLVQNLDPALAALIRELKVRELWDETIVICGGEFGRTPKINPAGGRDHWPHGFSIALAGGAINNGQVIGETSAEGKKIPFEDGTRIADIHATVLRALGVDHALELDTPVGRPMRLSEGEPIAELIAQ